MATGYSVTIKNDTSLVDGPNLVHTWLVLTDPQGNQTAISFTTSSATQAFSDAPGHLIDN